MLLDIILVLLYVCCLVEELCGHGLMQNPPSRNYMWRLGFDTERNYNDVGLNCGGYRTQWETHGGKCGTCGDPYQGPRDHEAGGRFAAIDRPISHCYNKNRKIDISIRITAYHKGYFEFRLCPHNDLTTPVNQTCLDQTVLTVSGTNQTRYDIGYFQRQMYTFQLDLPEHLTCQHCVIQWLYNTGNSYDCDINGCGMGVGPQEQFINCADVAILPDCKEFKIKTHTPLNAIPLSTSTSTRKNPSHNDNVWMSPQQHRKITNVKQSSTSVRKNPIHNDNVWMSPQQHRQITNVKIYTIPQQTKRLVSNRSTVQPRGLGCYAVGMFAGVEDSAEWCNLNCYADKPFCPATHCRCGVRASPARRKLCIAIRVWGRLKGFFEWCNINCNHTPEFCPKRVCLCL